MLNLAILITLFVYFYKINNARLFKSMKINGFIGDVSSKRVNITNENKKQDTASSEI